MDVSSRHTRHLSHSRISNLRSIPFRDDILIIIGLTAFVVAVQFLYLRPPFIYDPAGYFHSADVFPDIARQHRSFRLGLVLPVRLAQEVFGKTELAYYAVPTFFFWLISVSTYWIGRITFGKLLGMASAALLIVNPFIITWSSQIYPDLPAAALFTVALTIVLFVSTRAKQRSTLEPLDHALLVVVGLLLGGSYLVKETIVVLFPIVALVLYIRGTPWTSIFTVSFSAFSVFLLELFFLQVSFSDPLIRFKEILYKPDPGSGILAERFASNRTAMGGILDRTLAFPRMLGGNNASWIYFAMVSLTGFAAWADRKKGRVLPLFLWLITIWAVNTFLAVVEIKGQALQDPLKMRYWYPIFPPLTVTAVAGFWFLVSRMRRESWRRSFVIVTVLITSLVSFDRLEQFPWTVRAGHDELHQIRDYLRTRSGPSQIWTDGRTRRILPLFAREVTGGRIWEGQIKAFNAARTFRPVDDIRGLVLLDDDFFEPRYSGWRGSVPPELLGIPDTWDVQFIDDASELAILSTESGDDTWLVEHQVSRDWHWSVLTRGGRNQGSRRGDRARVTEGRTTLSLESDEEAIIVDGAAANLVSTDGTVELPAGAYVRFQVQLGTQGQGNMVPQCVFYPESGRVHVRPVTLWGVPNDYSAVGGICRAPDEPAKLRIAFRAEGPLTLELGTLRIGVDADGVDN